ncbi:MAG: hypothetical protein WC700_14350 [Gemmatimonadaceae bacterium]|jgi:hypothetical protein
MATILSQVPLTATADVLLVATAQGAGPAGWRVTFLGASWTGSVVLKTNRAAPGQAQSLTSIAYLTASTGATNAADTAITGDGDFIIPLASCAYDLYAVYTHTSGSAAVKVLTEDAGSGGGGGDVTAAGVDGSASQNTFGADIPYTGSYTFPGALAITGALTGVTQATFSTKIVSSTALATPSALAATALNAFASTVSGAAIMGYGTTNDVSLMNRAGTVVVGVGPNTTTTTLGGSLSFTGTNPAISVINLEGITLANNTNAIRGASVNPTRASGWISFSGTVGATPAQVYTDYRELHTTGVAEVLGFGSFPYMDSGSTCASMFAHQAIAYVSTGATVLTAAGAAGTGIFAGTFKTVIDGATFNSGAVAAAQFLSFQANVTDVQAADTAMANWEVASGGINAMIKFRCSAAKGATYFVNFADNAEPAEKTTAKTTATNNVVGNIKVLVGDQVGYINIHSAKAT